MSGHSKWSQIKRQKGVTDTRRGQAFTRLGREIAIAARQGGGDPQTNFQLRLAVQKARDSNMPMENIQRAIQRGAGGGADMAQLVEVTFEGYGAGGVAIMAQAATDNRNRTIQEVRNIFSRHGGNLGETGSVSWIFQAQGVITIDEANQDRAEEIALMAIDAGADDVKAGVGYLEVYAQPQDMEKVRQALEKKGLAIVSAELSMLPKSTVMADERVAIQNLKLVDKLEELEDVQKVFSNIDYSDEVLEKLRSQV